MTADLAFHEAICEASGNETLLETWRSLIGRITLMVLNVGPQRMSQLQDADAHRPLLEAIASGDEEIIRADVRARLRLRHARRARGGQPRRRRDAGRRVSVLASLGLPAGDLGELPSSAKRFARRRALPGRDPEHRGARAACGRWWTRRRGSTSRVQRVSQGTGVALLTDRRAARDGGARARARDRGLPVRAPERGWGLSASARAAAGGTLAAAAWGMEQVVQQLEEIRRAAEFGFRSVLIADLGVLRLFSAMREAGELPPDMQAKISVMLPAANPASARVLEDLGANTINVPVDLSLAQLAAIRAAVDVPLDVYVESPDNLGGIVRLHEIAEIVRVTAPVHVKFGLRNAPDLYPSGTHLEATAVALSRERVRRARIGLDRLARAAGN